MTSCPADTPDDLLEFSDLVDCVRREIEKRKAVYPRLVAAKKLSQQRADHEIRLMRHVLAVLMWASDRDGMIDWFSDRAEEDVDAE